METERNNLNHAIYKRKLIEKLTEVYCEDMFMYAKDMTMHDSNFTFVIELDITREDFIKIEEMI
jgi:hypothetical protein